MKVGIALNMLTGEGHSDAAAVLAEHLALGDLAEPCSTCASSPIA